MSGPEAKSSEITNPTLPEAKSSEITNSTSLTVSYQEGILKKQKNKGRRVQDGEHMYTCGGFILIFGKTNTIM